MKSEGERKKKTRTAGEAGWHLSRYNLMSSIPDTDKTVIVNLFRGTCFVYNPAELFLLNESETLDEDHPILDRFRQRGLIVDFDELEAIKVLNRSACVDSHIVRLTICPTMDCNFDCPYCYEKHSSGRMTALVQDDVIRLAERMLDASVAKKLHVTWFGGEPLLAMEVIGPLSERLMALATQKGIRYEARIVTNGFLLTGSVAKRLGMWGVTCAQITLDGLGDVHDRTRHLKGGGATFKRITENLRSRKMPFRVIVRHNVYENNREEIGPLKSYVEKLACESDNRIDYYPALVAAYDTAGGHGDNV